MYLAEPLKGMFTDSKLLILDFKDIPEDAAPEEDIRAFFKDSMAKGINPRLPENRQKFNDKLLATSGVRYLVSRYSEDRVAMLEGSEIARQGRTLHMGVDIFTSGLEEVYSPCDGQIVRADYEKQSHGYGNYVIIQPKGSDDLLIFLGHLGEDLPALGQVSSGEKIARLGDYKNNENGGWSRHLHIQMMKQLTPQGETPPGYSTPTDFTINSQKYPNPMGFFPAWEVKT